MMADVDAELRRAFAVVFGGPSAISAGAEHSAALRALEDQ